MRKMHTRNRDTRKRAEESTTFHDGRAQREVKVEEGEGGGSEPPNSEVGV
jgi:hypothetical protein